METFGYVRANAQEDICFGCAATYTALAAVRKTHKPEILDGNIVRSLGKLQSLPYDLRLFEYAINELRQGDIHGYNTNITWDKGRIPERFVPNLPALFDEDDCKWRLHEYADFSQELAEAGY